MSDNMTEEQVNEHLWIFLEGQIDAVNNVARAAEKEPLNAPAPVGRISEHVVESVRRDVVKLGKELDATRAREIRQYVGELDELQDEVKQFNTNTRVYMSNINYDGEVEKL